MGYSHATFLLFFWVFIGGVSYVSWEGKTPNPFEKSNTDWCCSLLQCYCWRTFVNRLWNWSKWNTSSTKNVFLILWTFRFASDRNSRLRLFILLIIVLAVSKSKHNVTVWRPYVCSSLCPVILTLVGRATHTRLDSRGGSTWRGLIIRRTDIFLIY